MLISRDYLGYLAREVTKKLIAGELIEAKSGPPNAGTHQPENLIRHRHTRDWVARARNRRRSVCVREVESRIG